MELLKDDQHLSSSLLPEKELSSGEADTEELAKFRQQWKKELGLSASPSSHKKQQQPPSSSEQWNKEEEAAGLYWMGAAAEKSGDMHAAIMYYRQAVQLEPDIEFRVSGKEPEAPTDESDDEGEYGDLVELLNLSTALQSLSLDTICTPNRLTQETHISALPLDVLRYIFRWVVSSQLDMRSLEQLSMVCKGFYMLSREPHLWRLACEKLWGDSIPSEHNGCWRSMYILKPHLHFNGVYVSKSSYVRPGEHSLDGFYKPYHTVVFYRYLRFFADGSVMYQTSPEEPEQVVSQLCHRHSSEAVLLGEYTVQGNKILVDVFSYRCHQPNHHQRGRGRGWKKQQTEITHEQRFHMELVLKNGKRQHFNRLLWEDYHCHSLHKPTGIIQVSHFTIDYKYTPFFFSRVKRFTTNSMGVL